MIQSFKYRIQVEGKLTLPFIQIFKTKKDWTQCNNESNECSRPTGWPSLLI